MDFITINLHSHSNLSDGQLSPSELANLLADNNAQVASLTDHDTIDGVKQFRNILKERGIGFISGVEISSFSEWGEMHLLGYNFDIDDTEINRELTGNNKKIPHYSKVFDLIHNAGGKVFLAHPLTISEDMEELKDTIVRMKNDGLDGIEAVYSSYDKKTVKALKTIAESNNMLFSAGTDYHGKTIKHLSKPVMNIKIKDWTQFRDGLGGFEKDPDIEYFKGKDEKKGIYDYIRKSLPLMKIVIPPIIGIILFTYSIFNLFIPEVEDILMSRKKEMIKELTHSAVSILDEFNSDYEKGLITLDEAMKQASAVVNHIRYGKENKDYFWITDSGGPLMIAHPYRKDLVGSDLSSYQDSNGEYVFLKIVETVKKNKEGYVEYQWQWKDEADIDAPKISYVKIYEKWGWIIGTGMYIDDVMREINRLEKYLIDISLFIIMVLVIILLVIVLQNIKKEKILKESRVRLQKSDEKYRALADMTNEGTLMIQNGKCTYSNPSVRKMLGYSENELLMMTAADLFPEPFEGETATIGEMLEKGEITPSMTETEILSKNRKKISVLMESGRIEISGREGYIVNVREISSRVRIHKSELRRNRLISELQSSLLFLSEPAVEISRQIPVYSYKTSIRNASKLMKSSKTSSFLVKSESGEILGIVTDKDLIVRAIAEEKNLNDPVYTIMTAPVRTADSRILIFEAISIMKTHDIRHLVLAEGDNEPGYVIRAKDLIEFQKYPATITAGELENSSSFSELQKHFSNVPFIVKALVDSGNRSRNIMRIVTSFTDILIKKIIDTAVEDIGSPPVKFAFICPGSLGRREQTLSSDQDNAIIFQPPEDSAKIEEVQEYFLNLGEIISDELNKAGFPYCTGGIMAKNEKWCRDIRTWKKYFSKWITKPEPEELLHFNMFFDFRLIYGDSALTEELKKHVTESLNTFPQFFLHLAHSSSLYKAPVNLFGNIIFDSKNTQRKIIDIKEVILPIVNFTRLYSLKHSINETNTFSRLDALLEQGVIHPSTHNELTHVYDFLNQIRLKRQAAAVSEERLPDNIAEQSSLTHIETAMLKNAVTNISELQKKINFDFKGSA